MSLKSPAYAKENGNAFVELSSDKHSYETASFKWNNTDYTVKYSNNTKIGKATVKVPFKGKYSDSTKLTFNINPKATSFTSLTPGSKMAALKRKSVSGVSG